MFPLRDDNPTIHKPVVTVIIIALNALVFAWQSMGTELEAQRKLFRYSMIPFNLTSKEGEAALVIHRAGMRTEIAYAAVERGTKSTPHGLGLRQEVVTQSIPAWLTLLTSMFMHGGLLHILGNMWFLWIFGNNIEDALGRARFVLFYLVTGVAAGAAHIASSHDSLMPTVGASGAISGVLGAYLLLYPRARVLTLIPLGFFLQSVLLPAMVFLPIWFLMQLLPALAGGESGIAFWAHIGGFLAGLALVKLLETPEHRGRGRRMLDIQRGQPWFSTYRGYRPRDPWGGF